MIEIIPNWHPACVHFTVALLITAAAIHLLSHFLPKGELANQLTKVSQNVYCLNLSQHKH
jgi:uncharacterized membrane protein